MEVPEWEFPVDYDIDEVISQRAKEWAETEKNKNQTIGESRAQQELAFRDYIMSEKSEKIGKSEKFFWITVNPKPGIDLPTLQKSVQKAYKKKWITNYAYVFETTKNNHIHSHGLVKATYESARARKEFGNSFKEICDITNVHCFKFVILDETKAKQKLEYMFGNKKESKKEDVELTINWRKQNQLEEIYLSEGPLILLDPRNQDSSL